MHRFQCCWSQRAVVGVGVWNGVGGGLRVQLALLMLAGASAPVSHPTSVANHDTTFINQSLTRVWMEVCWDEVKDQARIIHIFPYLRGYVSNSPGGGCNCNYKHCIAVERLNWRWCQCFVTVFFPLKLSWVGIAQYSHTVDATADFICWCYFIRWRSASGRRPCHYRDGGMNDTDSPHQQSRFGLQQEQDSGLAEPCSLTLRWGGVDCEESNRQAFTLQGGVKKRRWHLARPVQNRTIKLHRVTFISKLGINFVKSIICRFCHYILHLLNIHFELVLLKV